MTSPVARLFAVLAAMLAAPAALAGGITLQISVLDPDTFEQRPPRGDTRWVIEGPCVSEQLGGFEHRALRAYAIAMADAAAAADAWLTELGFSDSDLETLDGRKPIVLDGTTEPDAAGFVNFAIDGTARLELPTRSAGRVFVQGQGSRASIPATMDPATLERIGDIAFTIDERAFNSQVGQLIAHELFHARVDGDDEVLWLNEAMATAVGDAWGIRAGYGPDPGRKRAMRLDKPFDDNSEDARGFSYGYGKSPFLLYVGEQAGSQDRVEYLARFRVPTESREGKLRDRDAGMGYLYDRSIMPEGLTFPEAFPRFVAARNQIIPRQAGGRSVLWDPFDTEEDYYFTRLYRPLIDQARRVSKEHAFDRSVADLAADPIHLENTTLRFDPTAEEHERLMLARGARCGSPERAPRSPWSTGCAWARATRSSGRGRRRRRASRSPAGSAPCFPSARRWCCAPAGSSRPHPARSECRLFRAGCRASSARRRRWRGERESSPPSR